MTTQLKALQDKVAATTQLEQSAILLIQGLSDQIKAAANDPVALKAITDALDLNNQALADAISANTTPVVVPTPPAPATPPALGGVGSTDGSPVSESLPVGEAPASAPEATPASPDSPATGTDSAAASPATEEAAPAQ